MHRVLFRFVMLMVAVCAVLSSFAQFGSHPRMWVSNGDREGILKQIAEHEWKRNYFEGFALRVKPDVKAYRQDRKAYLQKFPLPWQNAKDGKIPAMIPVDDLAVSDREKNNAGMHLLQTAVDCGVLYFLTGEKDYAELAASVLNVVVCSWIQAKPSDGTNNGGWLDQENHLREAREYGAQIPIIYDFVHAYISTGNKVFNPVSQQMEDFAFNEAQQVFKTYCELAINHGIINSNWPVFESMSLLGNALAIEDEKQSRYYLSFITERSVEHQDALPKIGAFFKQHGGLWPESLNYADATTTYLTYMLTWLSRYKSGIIDGHAYAHIPYALTARYYLQYPTENENILYGDAHRHFGINNEGYELAYAYGHTIGDQKLIDEFSALLQHSIVNKGYKRGVVHKRSYGAEVYTEPVELLWFVPTLAGDVADRTLPVTNNVPFAGITLQRNINIPNPATNGLMFFIGGAGFVHGHASGMNMELFGKGYVLGNKTGRSSYTTDIHENYYRLFASHNTVVVNGASRGEGGWVNLGINTVKQEAAEPLAFINPVSPNHSFASCSFVDDGGDKAEATQLRNMGIVRTSPETGYYIDVFKSKSALPNQYHDYIYHNIGESVSIDAASKIKFKDDSLRYKESASLPWIKNKSFRHPGWHFFKQVKTAENISGNVSATFTANALQATPIGMRMFISGTSGRSYTTAMAPPSTEGPDAYVKKPTPTIVVRQQGEAWQNPFIAVYEPFEGNSSHASIQSVETCYSENVAKGVIVTSRVRGKIIRQIVIVQDGDDDLYENSVLRIRFKGRYMVLTLDENNEPIDIYIGSGKHFAFNQWKIVAEDQEAFACSVTVSGQKAEVNAAKKLAVNSPGIIISYK